MRKTLVSDYGGIYVLEDDKTIRLVKQEELQDALDELTAKIN